MGGHGKRCLGLTQTRNIVPLPLHGKKPDIRDRCWIDLPATMFENPAGKAMFLENLPHRLEVKLCGHVTNRAIFIVKNICGIRTSIIALDRVPERPKGRRIGKECGCTCK